MERFIDWVAGFFKTRDDRSGAAGVPSNGGSRISISIASQWLAEEFHH